MNAVTIPDTQLVYVPGHGELTVGDLRTRPDADEQGSDEDATVRMWVWIATRDKDAEPWRTGEVVTRDKTYPLSVFRTNKLVRLEQRETDR